MTYYARTSLQDTHLAHLLTDLHPTWLDLGLRLQRHHLPFEHRVILALRYMRQGLTQAELAEEYGVGQPTISGIINEVLPLVADEGVLTRYGETLHDLDDTLDYLARHGSTALLDGTLIETQDVSAPEHFSGKHHSPGKNVQVLTDVEGQPLWTSEPRPGARNDSRVAREEGIIEAADAHGVALVADCGYSQEYALVPHRKPRGGDLTPEQKAFNYAHSQIRSAVERAIRRIKTWRLLHRRSQPVHLLGLVLRCILALESRKLWW